MLSWYSSTYWDQLHMQDIQCKENNCSKNFFHAVTKIVGTLGPCSRSVDVISSCIEDGMSGVVARFDFSWCDAKYHQETLENLKTAIKGTKKLCTVMLYTVSPEFQVVNKSEKAITLKADENVILTPDQGQELH